jgi:zinc protease
VLIPGGSRDEDPAKAGLVDLYSQAWRNSGTAAMNGDQMDDFLETKAAHIQTFGGEESTSLAWGSLKGDADQVFSLALELLLHPKFSEDKLRLARQSELSAISRRNDDEGTIALRESTKLVYGADSQYIRQPEQGTIGSVSVGDLQAWHEKTIGSKLIVGVTGDFDSIQMEAKLRAVFEQLPLVKPTPSRREIFQEPKQAVYLINKEDVNQSNVEIMGLGTDRRNPDVPALTALNEVLGAFSGRLTQKLRTELGLSYELSGSVGFEYDHPGLFRVEVVTKSSSTVLATKAAMDLISGLLSQPVTEVEFNRARESIMTSFIFLHTRGNVLSDRELLEFYDYPADYFETYEARIRSLTAADVNNVARKYIHPDKLAVLVVGNVVEIKPPLTELTMGSVKNLDIAIP